MKQTTKRLLLVGGVSLALAIGYVTHKWSTHKVDDMGIPAQKKEEKPLQEKVPVKIDATVEKPNDGGAKLDTTPKKFNEEELRKKGFGVPKGLPYKPRKSVIKLEQSG